MRSWAQFEREYPKERIQYYWALDENAQRHELENLDNKEDYIIIFAATYEGKMVALMVQVNSMTINILKHYPDNAKFTLSG